MKKAKQAIKNFFVRVGHVVTRAEAFVKTAAATVFGGGVTAVGDAVHVAQQQGQFVLNLEHVLALKWSFIIGAAIAFVTYLSQFPAFKPKAPDQPKS
jgi:hypothetical protein